MIIYQAYNIFEKKRYIGATKNSLKQRKLDHVERASRGEQGKFYEGIRAHGSDSFIWEVIDTANSMNELAEKEKNWIKHYDSITNGFNTDSGGGFKKSVYQYYITTRGLIREFEGLNSAASACNASKQDISRAALGVSNEFAGFLWSYSKHDFLSVNKDERKKQVLQFDLEGVQVAIYDSVAIASKATGISRTCIARVCRGEREVTQGFKWAYR